MKKLIFLFLAGFALQCHAQQPELIIGPAIEVEEFNYDFGEVEQTTYSEYIYADFVVRNIGTEPLIISKCKGTCGCTTAKCDPTPILPGESTTIKVRYDSYRLGSFAKSMTLYSNAVNEAEKKVWIRGTIIERS